MAERVIPLRSTERSNETIRHIWLKSSEARSRSQSDYYRIRVGIAQGEDVSWMGEWLQSKNSIGANARFSLSGEAPLNIALQEDDELVVGIEAFGDPATLDGMAVEIKGSRVGAVGPQNVLRRDGDFPPGSEITSPLFAANANVSDGPTRDAINAIVDTLNASGVLDWAHSHPLTDA